MAELGVCYYPEHWPEDVWAEDARRMVGMGLSWVRIGEFAWSRIEPKLGGYNFDWLDRAIETLGQAGLKIIMSTPTATPPRWLLDKHPDMLAWDKEGRPRGFGSRRHYDFSHAGYRGECVRIANVLGERYGRHPSVKAWQIDNEYGCHDTTLSYSPTSRTAFQLWLKEKYKTVQVLNNRWGNIFWSMEYDRFDQIDLPNLTVTEPNPAHAMDFRRFSSDAVVAFNLAQVGALRPRTDAPLIHNYMGRITDFDHFAVGGDLDIASWDSYPLGFLEDRSDRDEGFKRRHMRCGDPDFQAFHHDLYRAVGKGRWWVMEQQPGPVNWAPHNPIPAPGMVRLWALEAFAHGAEVVCFFRWRQAPFAQEQMHAGLLRPDGELSEGGKEVQALAIELQTMSGFETAPRKVALIFDYESQWAWEVQPQDSQFDYFKLMFDIYRAMRRLGVGVDIRSPYAPDLDAYQLVFAPGLFAVPESIKSLAKNKDMQLVIGPRAGSRTEDFQIPEMLPPGLEGLRITAVDTLRPDASIKLQGKGRVKIWSEIVETDWDVQEVTETGRPVVCVKDNVIYWAGWPDDLAAECWVRRAYDAADLTYSKVSDDERSYKFTQSRMDIDYLKGVVEYKDQ